MGSRNRGYPLSITVALSLVAFTSARAARRNADAARNYADEATRQRELALKEERRAKLAAEAAEEQRQRAEEQAKIASDKGEEADQQRRLAEESAASEGELRKVAIVQRERAENAVPLHPSLMSKWARLDRDFLKRVPFGSPFRLRRLASSRNQRCDPSALYYNDELCPLHLFYQFGAKMVTRRVDAYPDEAMP